MFLFASEGGFVFVSVTRVEFQSGSVIATGNSTVGNVNSTTEAQDLFDRVIQNSNNSGFANVLSARVTGTFTSILILTTFLLYVIAL